MEAPGICVSVSVAATKMIPVMLFGVLFAKKQYSVREYLCVALITMGIVIFNLAKGSKNEQVL